MDAVILNQLSEQFQASTTMLEALASDVRQSIILQLANNYPKPMRVGDIKIKRCITRPTLSHHLKLLLDAKMIKYEKEGTKNYYYLAINKKSLTTCLDLLQNLKEMSENYGSSH